MAHQEAEWVGFDDGSKRFLHRWAAVDQPKATICVVHGLGEHGGRYTRLAERLVAERFQVMAFDQQGHGNDLAKAGCVQSYESMLDDISSFLTWAKSTYNLPVVLFGHSMGGNLVLNYVLRNHNLPDCVISSSPMIRLARPRTWLVEKVGRLLLPLAPNLRLRSNTPVERLMSDPEEQKLLREDALFHRRVSLRLGGALLDSGEWLLKYASRLETPTLLTHGNLDCLTCHRASKEFAERAGNRCQLEILDGQLHDPFRGLEKSVVISKFVEFANRCCQ